ncbi:hypothetical protein CB0940_10140 [Cercospora beticola]|uniref:Uncharacterized protein n=1 Tax=Cercospora beticola TaxID=122368 RepID=A0A2G5HSX6_CERBT|nr:hypothetical protein CB0940_10140 [Cercospora beticola]PIA95641.1 hypothetical protein CB0940_10140 [Cercospora beticola]WPB06847.1 hypothetical protein RHO25_011507 [Cercospora beticola]CAK1366768.1 unnamed protein product [Cercospora beticola]
MDYEVQSQIPLEQREALRTQDGINIPSACTEQSSTIPDSISPAPPAPADGQSYTTAELTSLFTSLETRLTGYAEALLGVGECLDSLQLQIKELRESIHGNNRVEESDSESEAEVKPKQQANEGVGADEHGIGAGGDGNVGVEGVEEERRVIDGSRTVNTETDADENGLGNMISGFVFGDDEPKESAF